MLRESRKDHAARISRQDDFWRYHRATETRHYIVLFRNGWTSEGRLDHPTNQEIEKFSKTTAEVDAFVRETWAEHAAPHAHPECEEHFLTYGSASYTNYVAGGETCIICGTNKLCGDIVRKHDFRSLSFEACSQRKIYHAGSCYHVSECSRCGQISSVDSSG